MREIIGIKGLYFRPYADSDINYEHSIYFLNSLKQHLLIFDKIGIPSLELILKSVSQFGFVYNDMKWLQSENMIFDTNNYHEPKDNEDYHLTTIARLGISLLQNYPNTPLVPIQDQFARDESNYLRQYKNIEAYPIIPVRNYFSPLESGEKSEIYHLVIENIPVIGNDVSWEELSDFKNDPESKRRFVELKNWINEISTTKLTPSEIQDKFDYLTQLYNQHMKVHRLKSNTGILETVITVTAEALENLAHLKFGELAKGIFSIRKEKVYLVEKELEIPGRELSYLIMAKERFSD